MGSGTRRCDSYCSAVCEAVTSCSGYQSSYASGTLLARSVFTDLKAKINAFRSTFLKTAVTSDVTQNIVATYTAWNAINSGFETWSYNNYSNPTNSCSVFTPAGTAVPRTQATIELREPSVTQWQNINNLNNYITRLNTQLKCNSYFAEKYYKTSCSSGYCSCVSDCCVGDCCVNDCATCGTCDCATCGTCPTCGTI